MGTAEIIEWDRSADKPSKDPGAVKMIVDFDPQSVEVTYAALGPVSGADTTSKGALSKTASQQTGQYSTMSVTLMFDTSTTHTSVQDKTGPLVGLTLPKPLGAKAPARPVVRFQWGSFGFTGTVESMTQTIDFFSDDGVPLRASVHLSLREVNRPPPSSNAGRTAGLGLSFGANAGIGATAALGASASAGASASIGTTSLTLSQSGDSVQAIAARSGGSVSWQAVATANGIDNPRLIPAGTVVDATAGAQLDAGAAGRVQADAGASASISASGS
jgi:Contractile injection system tube protein/LysM domain